MSKKHFIALADYLSAQKPNSEDYDSQSELNAKLEQWEQDARAVASVCGKFNRAFDRGLWWRYLNGECGPNGGEKKA